MYITTTINNKWLFEVIKNESHKLQVSTVFFVANRITTANEPTYKPNSGYLVRNPEQTNWYPQNLREDEVLLALKHNFLDIELQLQIVTLLLMTHYPITFYDCENGKEIILKELNDKIFQVK